MKNSFNVCTWLTLGGYVAGVTIGGILPIVLLSTGLLILPFDLDMSFR